MIKVVLSEESPPPNPELGLADGATETPGVDDWDGKAEKPEVADTALVGKVTGSVEARIADLVVDKEVVRETLDDFVVEADSDNEAVKEGETEVGVTVGDVEIDKDADTEAVGVSVDDVEIVNDGEAVGVTVGEVEIDNDAEGETVREGVADVEGEEVVDGLGVCEGVNELVAV